MKLEHIFLTSTIFLVLSSILINYHLYMKNKNVNETVHGKKIESFIGNNNSDEKINPEIPYSVTDRYLVIGGFCMQWGHTYSDDIRFHFPFDKVFVGFGTRSSKTNENNNVKTRKLNNAGMFLRATKGNCYWLAIGLKINPLKVII